jgi:hypothetical protein
MPGGVYPSAEGDRAAEAVGRLYGGGEARLEEVALGLGGPETTTGERNTGSKGKSEVTCDCVGSRLAG